MFLGSFLIWKASYFPLKSKAMREKVRLEPERILIIQPRQLGDVLLTTPSVRALRKRFPRSKIAFLVDEPFEPLLRYNQDLDLILVRKKKELAEPIKTIKKIRHFSPQLVIDYFANPRTTIISILSGALITLSYANKRRSRFYKLRVAPEGNYVAQEKVSLLKPLGIDYKKEDFHLIFNLPQYAQKRADEILTERGITPQDFLVVLDLFHKRPARQWREEYFMEIADRLAESFKAKVLITCLDINRKRAEDVLSQARKKHLLAPSVNLFELGALISRANLFLGADAGPKHIAVSQGTPSFTILGPSGEQWTPPSPIHKFIALDVDCRPCSYHQCPKPDHPCLENLTPDMVWQELEKFIKEILSRKVS